LRRKTAVPQFTFFKRHMQALKSRIKAYARKNNCVSAHSGFFLPFPPPFYVLCFLLTIIIAYAKIKQISGG
jgi:hypothetical protein